MKHSGNLAALPSGVMCIVVLVSGAMATAVISRGLLSVTAVRKLWQSIGMFTPAVMLLLVGLHTSQRVVAVMALLVVSTGISGFCLCGHHVNHIDIAPRHASVLYVGGWGSRLLMVQTGLVCPMSDKSLVVRRSHAHA